jgi:hypothetical protein
VAIETAKTWGFVVLGHYLKRIDPDLIKCQILGNGGLSYREGNHNSSISPFIFDILYVIRIRRISNSEAIEILVFRLEQNHRSSIRDLILGYDFASLIDVATMKLNTIRQN